MVKSNKKVIKINPAEEKQDNKPSVVTKVAAYIRVSTALESQKNSFDSQISYYENLIKSHAGWEFVSVYSDDGLSGTSVSRRAGFTKMIADALDGKIDLILVKSLSRFARNTVDSLLNIRKLKDKGVAVYFEKESINTMDAVGEFLITLMSSFAQEESRSISENICWGKRRQMANGNYGLPYSSVLGYKKGKNGLEIIPREAKVVRFIYMSFLMGYSSFRIADMLNEAGIPTMRKGTIWRQNNINHILTNEKYYGAALLQKYYTVDYLTKKVARNNGNLPQYYIPKDHPAIVSKAVYDMAKELIARRTILSSYKRPFSGKIICGICDGTYGSKVWHSNDHYRKTVWVCSNRFNKEIRCPSPAINDCDLQIMFTDLIKAFIGKHPNLLMSLDGILAETIREHKRFGNKEERLTAIRHRLSKLDISFREDICYVLLKGGEVTKSGIFLRLIDGSEDFFCTF